MQLRQVFQASRVIGLCFIALSCSREGQHQPATSLSATGLRLVSLAPKSGEGREQAFTLVAFNSNGANGLKSVRLLVNEGVDGRNACYVFYTPGDNRLLLTDNESTGSTAAQPGADTILENSQCRLNAKTSSASAAGDTVTLTVSLGFQPSFAGTKHLFGYLEDNSGATTSFQDLGVWVVTP